MWQEWPNIRPTTDLKQCQPRCSLSSTASASRRTGHPRSALVETPAIRGMPDKRAALLVLRCAWLKMMCPPTALLTACTDNCLPPVRWQVPPLSASDPHASRALLNPCQPLHPQCRQWPCPWPTALSSVACGAPRSQPSSAANDRQLCCRNVNTTAWNNAPSYHIKQRCLICPQKLAKQLRRAAPPGACQAEPQ